MNNFSARAQQHLPLFLQVFRFGVVGAIAATIHFSIVIALVQLHAFAPLVANIFAFMIAFHISYWGHRLWTFSTSDVLHHIAIPKLLLLQVLNLLANESLFYLFLSWHLPYPIALLIVLMTLPVATFISSKLWVFR